VLPGVSRPMVVLLPVEVGEGLKEDGEADYL
jgi:hypothetical protein